MKVCVLASGSEGNSTYIECQKIKILIDAGLNSKYIEEKLNQIGTTLQEINYIFITHTHTDHIGALEVIYKKYHPIIYIGKEMRQILKDYCHFDDFEILNEDILIDGVNIQMLKTSHDAPDSRGYVITENNSSLVYVTDTGYLNSKYFSLMKNKNIYVFESNHDIEKLINGKYPKWLQKRILGDEGHLSNKASSYYLTKLIGNNTKYIVLAHLSKENNTEELASTTIFETFKEYNINFDNIVIAKQREITEVFEV